MRRPSERRISGRSLSAAEAHARAAKGEVVLVDVRTADEWKETGLPASAHALTMHQEPRTFLQRLTQLMGNDRDEAGRHHLPHR